MDGIDDMTGAAGAARLRARLAAGGPLGAMWLSLGSPAVAECMADCRPDAVVFDLQHGLWTRERLEAGIAAVRQRAVPLVRTLSARPEDIAVALEAGAAGVVVPMIEGGEAAAAAVAATRYPPDGLRSGGGVRPLLDFAGHVAAWRAAPPFVAAMIETAAGLEAAAGIAAARGLDMVFVGTGDLALSLGTFPEFGPDHEAAVERIIAAAQAAGRPAGVFTLNETAGAAWRARGARLTVLACDNEAVRLAAAGAQSQFAASAGEGER